MATNEAIRLENGTAMNLDDLTDFLLVATHGGFAQASRESGRPKASLSRKVAELETALGVRLFDRGAKTIRLTAEGTLLLEQTSGPLRELNEAADFLRDRRTPPFGLLKINVPNLIGQLMMGRLAAQFSMAYPDVQLSITLEDREVDLISEGYDLVVRVNPERSSELVGRCFARDQILVVSTPAVKENFKKARRSAAISLPTITRETSSSSNVWRISGITPCEISTHTVLRLPLLTMIRDAALTGIGAARLPRLLVADDLAAGRLVSWGAANDQLSELWALHPSRRLASAKIKAFMSFLEGAFRKA